MMNQYLSQKLTFFSFWLIVLVVLLHSLNVTFNNCDNWICSLQYLLSQKLAQIAVPIFFFISGYVYFLKADMSAALDYSFFSTNLGKRLKTIVVPFMLWCTLWFLFMFGMQYIPIIGNFFSEPLHKMSAADMILNLYYYPLNYPFWFLRELIVLFIFTPIIFLLTKHLKIFAMIITFIITMYFEKIIQIGDLTILSSTPLLFFVFGCYCSLQKISIVFKTEMYLAFVLIGFWLLLDIISLQNEVHSFFSNHLVRAFDIIKNIIGGISVWYFYDFLNRKEQWENFKFYSYSFFIFAFHGIPTLIFVQVSIKFFNNNPILLGVSYFLIVPFVILMCILIAKAAKKITPNLYAVFIGARNQ